MALNFILFLKLQFEKRKKNVYKKFLNKNQKLLHLLESNFKIVKSNKSWVTIIIIK